MGEDFFVNNTVMGDSVKTSQEFLYSHRELDLEKRVSLSWNYQNVHTSRYNSTSQIWPVYLVLSLKLMT